MEFRKWNFLSFLKYQTESLLSFSSTSLDVDPNLIYLCGFWLVFVFLCCRVMIPSLFTFWKTRGSGKSRAKRRRKGGTPKGWSYYQKETEETRRLIALVKSPLGQHHDTTCFRQLLCPDPFCEVCNRATTEINQLLFPEGLDDASPSVSSLASTAPMTESSFTMSPAFPEAPPEDLLSGSPLVPSPPPFSILSPDDFLAPSLDYPLSPAPFPPQDSELPVDHFSTQPTAFSPPPVSDTQSVDAVHQSDNPLFVNTIFTIDSTLCQDINALPNLPQPPNPADSYACHQAPRGLSVAPPPDCTVTVTQSKAISILFKSVPETSTLNSPPGLLIPSITGIDHSGLSVTEFYWWQAHAKGLLPSTLPPCDFNQEFLALHTSETSFGRNPAANLVEPGNLSFLSPDVLALLERQVQKRSDFLMWKEKEKGNYSFSQQLDPQHQLSSSGKMPGSVADKHDSAVSLTLWSSKGKPQALQMQPPHLKTLGDNLQQKGTQFFWGLPSLHSESLPSAFHVLSDCPSTCIFNRIPSASIGQPPELSQSPSLSLPEIQSPRLPQTQPQSQPMVTVQSEAQQPCQLPVQPSDPLPQIRICGVYFHRPQKESVSLKPSDINHLEWHVLQKQLENVWGLPAIVQRSHKEFCSSPPVFSQQRGSKLHALISIVPGEYPLSDEIRNKLEQHLRKRLIQHRWGLPRRIVHSMSLMKPPEGLSKISALEGSSASRITELKGENSQNLNVGLDQSGEEEFHEKKSSVAFQLEKDAEKDQGYSPEKESEDDLLSSSDKDQGSDSEQDLKDHLESKQEKEFSRKDSRTSEGNQPQNEMGTFLKVHLRRKSEEISEGHLPLTVSRSLHTNEQTLQHSVQTQDQAGPNNLSSLMVERLPLNTSQQLSFIDSSVQQLLENHIKRFRLRMLWGLPSRVLESLEIFKSRHSSSQSKQPSSTHRINKVNSKSVGFKSIRGKSKGEENLQVTNVGPELDHPVPATSRVGRERKGTLRQSPSDVKHEPAAGVQKMQGDRHSLLPVKHNLADKSSQRQCIPGMRCTLPLPARQAVATHKPNDKRMNSYYRAEMLKAKERQKNLDMLAKANKSREIFRAEELDAIQPKSGNTGITTKPQNSSKANMRKSQVETTVSTERRPSTKVNQDPKLSDLKKKAFGELQENREQSKFQRQPSELTLSSGNLTFKSSQTQAQPISSGDMGASQVLQTHLVDSGISMEQRQRPWVPEHIFRSCQSKNFPPAPKRVSLLGRRTQELGGGDAGLETSQPRKQSIHTQHMAFKETHWSETSQPPSKKGQPPPENRFQKNMKHFLQWISPEPTAERKEAPQEKGSPLSCLQSIGLAKSRGDFTRMMVAHHMRTGTRKFQDRLCYHVAHPLPVKCWRTQQNAKLRTWAQPFKGYLFHYRGPCFKATNVRSCYRQAFFASRIHPIRIRWMALRQPWHLRNSYCVRSIPPFIPHMVPAVHLNPMCRRSRALQLFAPQLNTCVQRRII